MGWEPLQVDQKLWIKKFVRVPVKPDGNCLYQAASFGLQLEKVY
jgi:hypothetical protein